MSNWLEWLARFFGHIPVEGVEALLIRALQAGLVLITAYLISRGVQRWIAGRIKRTGVDSEQVIKTYQKLLRYIIWIVAILASLHVMGFDLSHVFTTSGLFAVAIGFALKDVAGNYFGGMIIKANDLYKDGDILGMNDEMVRVKAIGVRDTLVRTKDGLDILIPNGLIVQSKIINYTLKDSVCRVWTTIGVSYSSDLELVRNVLVDVCERLDGTSDKILPRVFLNEFGDSAVIYLVSVTIENPWNRRIMRSNLNEAIWGAFKEAGIVIAFPQLDVHVNKNQAELTNF
jgi:small-conductance mechanosensitive channel